MHDIEKKRIAVRIPRVHEVAGAPHDLLSVSNMKKHGFSFHFTPGESYMLTPMREKVMMIEKGGLFWLRIARALGPGSRDIGHAVTSRTAWSDECNYLNQPDPVRGADTTCEKCDEVHCETCNLSRRPGITNVPLDVMHRRLNHSNVDVIKKMAKGGSLDVNVIAGCARRQRRTKNRSLSRGNMIPKSSNHFSASGVTSRARSTATSGAIGSSAPGHVNQPDGAT